ncbi:MAG: response regulator transcription factor [Bacteroidota bacterium]
MVDALAKIMIVDDEDDILEFLSYNLRNEQYDVKTVRDGKNAVKVAKNFEPDLILLDIMMPELDGVEVCRMLREEKQFDSTIIAFLTARNEDFTLIAALDAGGDDFITKPVKTRVLISRIRALLRRPGRVPKEEQNSVLEFGDLIIDPEKFIIQLQGKNINLARKEFELLFLLVSKPGKVFSRDEIFRRVWGTDVIVGNRTIDVHIRKLREKMGDKFIKTVKGIGYKFEF